MSDRRSPASRLTDMVGPINTSDPRSYAASPFSVVEVNNYPPGDEREPIHLRHRQNVDEEVVDVEVDIDEAVVPEIHVAPDGSTTHDEPLVVDEAGPGEEDTAGDGVDSTEPASEPTPEPIAVPKNVTGLQSLTVDELRGLAAQEKISVDEPATKAKLLTALRQLVETPSPDAEVTPAEPPAVEAEVETSTSGAPDAVAEASSPDAEVIPTEIAVVEDAPEEPTVSAEPIVESEAPTSAPEG